MEYVDQFCCAAMELTTVFHHRVTTTGCARSSVDVGLQTSEQTNAITRLEGRPTLQTSCHQDFPWMPRRSGVHSENVSSAQTLEMADDVVLRPEQLGNWRAACPSN